jgi:hypothetical protein
MMGRQAVDQSQLFYLFNGQASPQMRGVGPGGRMRMIMGMGEHVEGRLAFLKTERK